MTSEPGGTESQLDGAVSGENLAAKRYAQAAFEIAKEHGEFMAWREALSQIAAFMSDPEVRRVLENTRVSQEPKQNLVGTALGDMLPLALNLARLLVRKNRTALAPDVAGYFEQLMEQERGISRVRAVTAVPMNDAERDALVQRLRGETGNEVILQTEVDPSLIGGIVLQIGDRLIDASTRGRLQAMRESLVGSVA